MEIGKMEKVDLQNILITTLHSPLRPKLEGMQPGEAFVVSDIERASITGITQKLAPKKFVTRKITSSSFRVIRIS